MNLLLIGTAKLQIGFKIKFKFKNFKV